LNSEHEHKNQERTIKDGASYDARYDEYSYDDEIDLRELLATIWKRKNIIIAVTVLAVLASGIISFFVLEPVYEASAQILASKTSVPEEVIKSPYFMEKVIDELDLPSEEKYTPFALTESVTVQAGKSADIVIIKVEDEDPQRATDIVNTVARLYIDFVQEKGSEVTSLTVSFLQERLAETKEELDAAETQLDEIRRSGQLEILDSEVARLTQELNSWKSTLSTGEVRKKELLTGIEELNRVLASTPQTIPGPPDYAGRATQIPNQTYQDLETSLARKQVELKELEVRMSGAQSRIPPLTAEYDSVYEKYVETQRDVGELESKINRLNASITSLDAQIVAASTSVQEVLLAAPAVTPVEPVKPRKMLNVAVAGVLGLFVSILVVFFIEYWRSPQTKTQS